jgi:hypothetical protein
MNARQALAEPAEEFVPEPDWFEDPGLAEDWGDLPPEAYQDDLGLSPEDLAAWRAGPEAGFDEDEAVTAALRAGTLPADDGIPEMLGAAIEAGGDLQMMSDAHVIGVVMKAQETASRAAARKYEAEMELVRRRPARRWDRHGEKAEVRRDERDGACGDPDAPALARPVLRPSREAVQELMLAGNLTEYQAEAELRRAADLAQRLPVTLAMLRQGRTDPEHVKVMDWYTQDLSDENAAKVDASVAPRMEHMTTGELRDVLRRELIRTDPAAAERHRKRSERNARVSAYANPDGTGTLAFEQVPAAQAAAAKSRLNALARAAKSAGSPDPMSLLETKAGLGLLLGTFPYIPPPSAEGGDRSGGSDSSGGDGGAGRDPGDWGRGGEPGDSGPRDEDSGDRDPAGNGSGGEETVPDIDDEPTDDGVPGDPDEDERPDESPVDGGGPGWLAWPSIPSTASAPAPGCAPLPAWLRPADPGRIRLLAPWRTLAGLAGEPGELSWFGTITPQQARELAAAAAADPATRWQVIVTDDAGHAIAVTTVRRRGATAQRGKAHTAPGLIDEVTLTIQASFAALLARNPDPGQEIGRVLARLDPGTGHGPLPGLLADAIAAANRAAAEAEQRARLDAAAGGCAHTMETQGYRVTGTLRRWLAIRDRTCRSPVCRRRAVQCDQDHTVPYDKGGRTCTCDLGSLCRVHHQLKQLPGWRLTQDGGVFTWTTPAGLAYRKEPYRYPV